ncbi:MAG: acetyl-CoA carboxylase carboxyltransferase subunit beta [Candidatus Omnitrophica bacterium]|nr:acetyl-CoA carboxylase carboxyltransferase subunit beta [Candidatus Omnitrophota bacterium]
MKLFRRASPSFGRNTKRFPPDLWSRCGGCGQLLYNKALEEDLKVCPKCDFHFLLTAPERLAQVIDAGTFDEWDADLSPMDPLNFRGPARYAEKLQEAQRTCGMRDACITGAGMIGGHRVAFGVTDSRFLMGSMGSVVGEKLTRAIERGAESRRPVVIVSGSGGGARMHEGMLSLMQMAKTSAALMRLDEAGGFFISVLTHPTMAGVFASFASLGDLIIAEPKALIGFTGPRVIEQTIRQKLPEGFQRSEFLLEHGLLDLIVHRRDLKASLANLLAYAGSPQVTA